MMIITQFDRLFNVMINAYCSWNIGIYIYVCMYMQNLKSLPFDAYQYILNIHKATITLIAIHTYYMCRYMYILFIVILYRVNVNIDIIYEIDTNNT